jgi:hypothetical protein
VGQIDMSERCIAPVNDAIMYLNYPIPYYAILFYSINQETDLKYSRSDRKPRHIITRVSSISDWEYHTAQCLPSMVSEDKSGIQQVS